MRNPFLQSLKTRILPLFVVGLITTGTMAATISTIGNGNWSATAWPNTSRTGTITTSTGSSTVTGAGGSLFLTEISIGNIIKTTGNVIIGTVLSITSNTSLTLAANAASTNAGIAYNVQGLGSGDIAKISGGDLITIDVSTAICAGIQSDNLSAASPSDIRFNFGSHLSVSGVVNIGGDASHALAIDMANGGILTCWSFVVINGGFWTPGTGTIELTTTNTLPSTFFTSFNNLTITAGTTTTSVGLSINNNLSIADGATFSAAAFSLTVTGTATVGFGTSGNLMVSSATGAKTFGGMVTINIGGIWNNSANAPVSFHGGITNNGTFTAGTGVQTFNTNPQALTGTFSIPSVTVTSITLTNNNTLSVTTSIAGTGTLTQASNALLNIMFSGSFGITGFNAAANGNTVNYGFAETQTVFATTYYHLTLSNTSAKTLLAGTTTISGNLTLSGTASTLAVVGLNIGGNITIGAGTSFTPSGFTHSVAGNWSRSGTFTAGTSTIIFNGSLQQTITAVGGENFSGITINNSGVGIQLINSITTSSALTMSQGNIDLNGQTLTLGISIPSSGTLARTSGTLIGTGSFIRWFNTATIASGSATGLFPTGTLNDYQPFYVSAPVSGPTTGGTIGLSYSNTLGNTSVTFPDGGSTVVLRKNLNWNLVNGNGLAGGAYELRVEGTGYGTVGSISDLRLSLINSVVGNAGINAGTVQNPQINRTGLSLLNLTNSFYIASVNVLTTPLPITLISFVALVVDKQVALNWSVSAEIDNHFFTVQRSKDHNIWENILQVNDAGNGRTVSSYSFYDHSPYSSYSYYRLMLTNFQGDRTYSYIRSVDLKNKSSTITFFPNPATDHITFSFDVMDKYVLSLINANGQIIYGPALITRNNFELNVSDLKTGLYFISIKHDSNSEVRKVAIVRDR